ncbi:MAG: hypothetical protein J6X38_03030, partial [Abditibacteriota bacterium]|nr:hypothetical protein [Abditibacteriota bacterium]
MKKISLTFIILILSTAAVFADVTATGRAYSSSDDIVSTSVFSWYASNAGQLSGPWIPVGGRSSWTGEVPFWKNQIKHMMSANIDTLWVHLIRVGDFYDYHRGELLRDLYQLRMEGYKTPTVAPFLDPLIQWGEGKTVDVNTDAGFETFMEPYIYFYRQYFDTNPDALADSYIQTIDGRVLLDTWHVHLSLANHRKLTRAKVENRLKQEFGAAHPVFNNGIYMVGTAYSSGFTFLDEKMPQFEVTAYSRQVSYNNIRSLQLKGGYWDQNVRNPGSMLARNGGTPYKNAWAAVSSSDTDRIYIESWNEYDEGSGIYPAIPQEPYIPAGSAATSSDVWSSSGDPCEYIRTTATYASAFNNVPEYDGEIIDDNMPETLLPGQTANVEITVRNLGDNSWRSSTGVKAVSSNANVIVDTEPIDDNSNEIPEFGGIFRGRPVKLYGTVTAPSSPGTYTFNIGLKRGSTAFGSSSRKTIVVLDREDTEPPSVPTNLRQSAFTETTGTIRWNPSTDDIMVRGYNIYKNNRLIGTTTGTEYTIDGLTASSEVSVCVSAYDYYGNTSDKCDIILVTAGRTFFEDGFADISNWTATSDKAVWSGSVNHGDLPGSGSLYIDTTTACIANTLIAADSGCKTGGCLDGQYSVWFLDPGVTNTRGGLLLAFCDDSGAYKGRCFIGVNITDSYKAGIQKNGRWYLEDVKPRSAGWHKLEMRVNPYSGSAEDVEYFLDGLKVASSEYPAPGSAIRRVYLGYSGAACTRHNYDDAVFAAGIPPGVGAVKAASATEDSVTFTFRNYAKNATSFVLYDASGNKTAESFNYTLPEVTETGLAPNTRISRRVKTANAGGESKASGLISGTTLSAAPTADSVTALVDGGNAAFTAAGGFGAGTLAYYRYVWDENPACEFTGSETKWSNGTLTLPVTGVKYLHVKGYNSADVANGEYTYGPFFVAENTSV